jgi:hypothetical protein
LNLLQATRGRLLKAVGAGGCGSYKIAYSHFSLRRKTSSQHLLIFDNILRETMSRAFLLFILGAATAAQQRPGISAYPNKVELGKLTRLTWTSTCDSAFLSGIGKVSGSGSIEVAPGRSTVYTIICDGRHGIEFASTRVKFEGERGNPDLPNPFDFPKGQQERRKSIRYADVLDLTLKTLQDGMKFTVYSQHAPHDQFYVFFTDRQEQPDMLYPSDRGIRARRVAYEVQIFDPGNNANAINFEVRAIAEYQRLGEGAWHLENNQRAISDAISRLRQKLENPL